MSKRLSKQRKGLTEIMDDGARRMTSSVDADTAQRASRRARRLPLEMPVFVSSPGEPSYDEGKTLRISALGALLELSRNVDLGQELLLTNPKSLKQISCRVRNIKPKGQGVNHVGVEFATESNKFWGIAFPSGDCDPADRRLLQRSESAADPSFPPLPGQFVSGMPKAIPVMGSEATELPLDHEELAKFFPKPRRLLGWPMFALAGFIFLFVARYYKKSTGSVSAKRSLYQEIAPDVARLIPGIETYRLATPADFDPDAVAWLTNSGRQASGEIQGAFSAFGQSRAYVLVGKDGARRIVILANGQLRCDAQYRRVAVVARVPKQAIQKIIWAKPPPAGPEGDGLVVVRTANDPGSSVVLFLRGHEVVSGTPTGFWQIPLS